MRATSHLSNFEVGKLVAADRRTIANRWRAACDKVSHIVPSGDREAALGYTPDQQGKTREPKVNSNATSLMGCSGSTCSARGIGSSMNPLQPSTAKSMGSLQCYMLNIALCFFYMMDQPNKAGKTLQVETVRKYSTSNHNCKSLLCGIGGAKAPHRKRKS